MTPVDTGQDNAESADSQHDDTQDDDMAGRDRIRRFDVAIIGGGSAAETLVAELDGSGLDVVVFEQDRVGGECAFVACMPTKAMLHDAAVGRSWTEAVRRRMEVAEHLDDAEHAADLARQGATLVRGRALVTAPGEIEAAGHRYCADHIVLATGSEPVVPPIDGLGDIGDRCWTSADAMTTDVKPMRLTIIGGGVIGCELATLYARFGTEVHLLDNVATAFPDLPSEIGSIVDEALRDAGVRIHRGVEVAQVEPRGSGIRVRLADGACVDSDHLLIAAGTRPRTRGLGLARIGIDENEPMTVGTDGRVEADGSVWAMGDVAGYGEYTHLASHQGRVVADSLTSTGQRRFDDVVAPACVFTIPPVITIGPVPAALGDSVMWVSARLSEIPRAITDDFGDGLLTIAVDRSTRAVVAAHGVGARFDELAAALVTAIDAEVPVEHLARSMWLFPTVGELLGVVYSRAAESLGSS